MPKLRPKPDLDAVLQACYLMEVCRRVDRGEAIDGHRQTGGDIGPILGEMDWHQELYSLLYEDDHAVNGCVCCKGERMSSGTDEFATPHDQTTFPNKLNPNDHQVGGAHYREKSSSFQHWDWVAANFGPGYYLGQITKYLARWRSKAGAQDVAKSLHYCDKLISLYVTGQFTFWTPGVAVMLGRFADEQKLSKDEEIMFELCCTYSCMDDLQRLRTYINNLLTAIQEGTVVQTDAR